MKITRITEINEAAFQSMIPRVEEKKGRDLIRLGVTDERQMAVGALIAACEDGIIELHSIFVLRRKRRKGYGTKLFSTLMAVAEGTDADMVTASFIENKEMNGFFRHMGFELVEGRPVYATTIGELKRLPLFKKIGGHRGRRDIKSVAGLTPTQKAFFQRRFWNCDYDPNLSTACFDEGGCCKSALLVRPYVRRLHVMWLEVEGRNQMDIPYHIYLMARRAETLFGADVADVVVSMSFLDEKLAASAVGLLGDSRYVHVMGHYIAAVRAIGLGAP